MATRRAFAMSAAISTEFPSRSSSPLRASAYGVQRVAARVSEMLRLLTGGRRSAPGRHKTITAVLDWSYRLLSGEDQTLLRRLAVFVGGFTLESAAAIAADADAPLTDVAD